MRRFATVATLLALSACQSTPPTTTTTAAQAGVSLAASAAPLAAPTVAPTPTPAPSATLSPTPTPTPSASATPTPAPRSSDTPLAEANHGNAAFPKAPTGKVVSLQSATITAGAGATTAIGAIDGNLYTEWSARTGVGDSTTLTLDLGTSRTLAHVDVLADASPAGQVFYVVEGSEDGDTWLPLSSAQAMASNEAPTWGTASFDPTPTRFVRITPTSWGTSWVAVWEVQVRE